MRGYTTNIEGICKGFKYEVGKTYKTECGIEICDSGLPFCENPCSYWDSYRMDPTKLKLYEVEAIGDIKEVDGESITNEITIVREIPWDEVYKLCNFGDCNIGNGNSGRYNIGDKNSGNYNTGNRNTGDWNIGTRNIGNWNIGDRNIGNWNRGNWNIGDKNTGCLNIGDWNYSNYNNGFFCTETHRMLVFDREADIDISDSVLRRGLIVMLDYPKTTTMFVDESDMTEKEKNENKGWEVAGGYFKTIEPTEEEIQKWWDELPDTDKNAVKAIPNFDAAKFYKCTRIRVE